MDTDLLAETPQIRQAGSLSNNMPKPWEQFSSQAGQSGPWNKFQPAVEPGSPEAIQGIEDGAKGALHALGATARPWGPLGVAATGGAALGSPGGLPGMAAGAGVGAGAYGLAHLIDLPLMAVNEGAHYAGYPNVDLSVGRLFDNFVNQYNPLPEPQGKTEEYLAAASGGIKDAIGGNRAGAVMKGIEVADRFRPVFQGTANALTDAPKANAALGAASGVGAQFGSDVTDGSTSGMVTGALTPVMAAVLGRGAIRGGVNAMGGPSVLEAYGRGFAGRGQDVVMQTGEIIPKTGFFSGARLEAARQVAGNNVHQQIQDLIPTQEGRELAAANIERNAALLSGEDGYKGTSGALSGDERLTSIENALYQTNPEMRARYKANQRAISGSVLDALTPQGATIEQSQGFISRLLGNMSRSAERNAKNFEDVDMNRANDLVDSRRAAVTSSATADQQTAASTTARRQAGDMMVDEKKVYKDLYAAVDPKTQVTFDNAIAKIDEILADGGKNAAEGAGAAAREKIGRLAATRIAKPFDSFSELQSDIQIVNDLIRRESGVSGNPSAVRLYNMYKKALEADREAAGASNSALKAANQSFATYKQRWANGPAGEALDRGTLPSETMGKYMSSPEGAAQFNKTVGTTPQGKQAAGDYLSASVAKASGATPTKQSVTAAINKNPAISTFPEVKAAEQAKARQISAATTFQGKQAGVLKERQATAAAAKKEATSSLPAKYADGTEDAAINSVRAAFGDKNDPTTAVRSLLKVANKDKTGKALEGLQNATRKWLGETLFNSNNVSAGKVDNALMNADTTTSMAKTGDAINENKKIFKNLKGILPDDEISNIQKNYQRLQFSTKIRNAAAGQSSTTFNKADQKALIESIEKGYTNIPLARNFRTIRTFLNTLKTVAQTGIVNTRAADIIEDIRLQAFLDPDKMKQLLLRPTESNWKRTSWASQQMNILMQEVNRRDGQKDDDNEEKPTPAPAPKKAAAPVQKAGDPSAPRRMRWNPQTGQLEASE
jgi:hypothetical protein